MSIIVYSTSHCPECKVLKMFLRDHKIDFEIRNCSTHPEYWEEVRKWDFLGVPVTVINGKPIQGFKPEEIMSELEKR